MGYAGLEHFNDSDNASATAYKVVKAMIPVLAKRLPKKDNEMNTAGWIDVGLILESLAEAGFAFYDGGVVEKFVKKVITVYEAKIAGIEGDLKTMDKEDKTNAKYHLKNYTRILDNLIEAVWNKGI